METLSPDRRNLWLPSLSRGERELAWEYLAFTKSLLKDAVDGLDGRAWASRMEPDGWSIAQCVEHLALAGDLTWQLLQDLLGQAPSPGKQALVTVNVKRIICSLTDRSRKLPCLPVLMPERPSDAALARFMRQRDRLLDFVLTTHEELKNRHTFHPAVGTINLYQLLLLEGAHSARHVLQIEEIKGAIGYPSVWKF